MEKISGIIPASPRMKMVEIAEAQPARPGAPLLGRPMGKNSIGERITISKELERMRATGEFPTVEPAPTYKNTPENSKLKTIEALNKKFFSNPADIAKEAGEGTRAEETLKNVEETQAMLPQVDQLKSRAPQANLSEKYA